MFAGCLRIQRLRISTMPRDSVLLLPALAYLGCLYGFHSNLVTLVYSPLYVIDYHLRHAGVYDILLALWCIALAYCAGKRFLRLLGISSLSDTEELVFSIATGMSLFSWLTMALSLAHGLYRPVAYLLLVVPSLLWQSEIRQYPREVWRALSKKLHGFSWSMGAVARCFLLLYIVAVLGVILFSALGPSFEYDDLAYHLAGPKNFVQNHKLVFLPDVPMTSFPKNIEMLYTLALLLHNDITAKLVGFLFGAATILLAYGFCERFASRNSGYIAAAILAASPLFIWEMRTAHIDVSLTFYVFSGVYATVLWLKTRAAAWLRFACLCLAFSLGVKYWALLGVGIIVLLVFAVRLIQSKAFLPAASDTLKLAFYSSLGLVPWGVVNLYYTGNPIFPVLNSIFPSRFWTDFHTNMLTGELFRGGIRITFSNWWDLIRLWWEMSMDPRGRFDGSVGLFYLLLLPLLLLIPKARTFFWILPVFSTLYYCFWAVTGPSLRFLLPALPGLAAAAAIGTTNLLRIFNKIYRPLAIISSLLLAASAVLASPFFERYGSWSHYGSGPISTLPLKYLAGRESRSDYLDRVYTGYRAIQFLNQIPGAKKVYFVNSLPDGFYLEGKAGFHYSPWYRELATADARRAHDVIVQNGITHVVVGQLNQHLSFLSSRESSFTRRYLRKVFQGDAHIVYEVLPHAIDQEAVAYDFLDHLERAQVTTQHAGEGAGADRKVRSIGGDSRYCMVVMPPSEIQFQVDVPKNATLSFATGVGNPGCPAKRSFHVKITPSDGEKRAAQTWDFDGAGAAGFVENKLDLSTYAGRRVFIAFKAEGPSECGESLWADPVLTAMAPATGEASPESHPVISGASIAPDRQRLGQAYTTSFHGSGLTSETYFDIRYRGPGKSVDDVAYNWQQGASAPHTIAPETELGKWIITGARPHQNPHDHEGDFFPVSLTVEVIR